MYAVVRHITPNKVLGLRPKSIKVRNSHWRIIGAKPQSNTLHNYNIIVIRLSIKLRIFYIVKVNKFSADCLFIFVNANNLDGFVWAKRNLKFAIRNAQCAIVSCHIERAENTLVPLFKGVEISARQRQCAALISGDCAAL
jgi:hypothetical protein